MKHRWAALFAVLAFCALVAGQLDGQGASQPPTGNQRIAGTLKQNVPNPFNPETRIQFLIGMQGDPPVCVNPNQQHRVTLRIHDALTRVVALPILQGGGDRAGQPVDNLVLGCGDYFAYWDGTIRGTSQKVPSGVYFYMLIVDGQATTKKMTVRK